MTQIGQRTHDSIITPVAILGGHAHHQLLELTVHPWATRVTSPFRPIELARINRRYRRGTSAAKRAIKSCGSNNTCVVPYGFARRDIIVNSSDAAYRPMGIAVGPDGSLYLGETEKGKIWRIQYKGKGTSSFGDPQLAAMEQRKLLPHIRTPDEKLDNLQKP